MESRIGTNINQNEKFNSYLDDLIQNYFVIQKIIIVATTDVLKNKFLNFFMQDKLVCDTIKILQKFNYDFEILLDSNIFNRTFETFKEKDLNSNLFLEFSKIFNDLINSKVIINYINQNNLDKLNTLSNIPKKFQVKRKKCYEIEILSDYLIENLESENIYNIIEMGCGKSYLNDDIILNEELIYIGIDKKDDLIEKSKELFSKNLKKNIFSINSFVTLQNFDYLYDNEFQNKLNTKFNKNILLFGLHSCGNLTSDSIKIFSNKQCFSHLIIIGCCLHALKEYITPEATENEVFKDYLSSAGFDNKGNFLEGTLIFENRIDEIGYPLSNYVKTTHCNLFLGRTARNSAMTTFPKNCDKNVKSKNVVNHKKFFYRALLQAFIEINIPELQNFYGYGEIKISIHDTFAKYVRIVIKNLSKILQNKPELLDKVNHLNSILKDDEIDKFERLYEQYEDIVWAVFLIRIKFSKIVEYIIALDRVIYLKENNIDKIDILKIFDEKVSVRNLLIYASKK